MMNYVVDKPRDRLITERIQMLSGWVDSKDRRFALTAHCGEAEIPLREFVHPVGDLAPQARGFWGFLIVQELLRLVRQEYLKIDLLWNRERIGTLHLRVSPLAREMAERCPLNLRWYPVRNRRRPISREKPGALIFPAVGGVGASSLNLLMRRKMFEEGWDFPVYDEANDPALWAGFRARSTSPIRWVDGHLCYGAARDLPSPWARITLLREPTRRLLSIFNYCSLVHPHEFPYPTFREFVFAEEAIEYSQAFRLVDLSRTADPRTMSGGELYRRAMQELNRSYSFVGITELYEESVFLICDLAGYDKIGMWWRILSAPPSAPIEELDGRVEERMRRLLEADLRLYQECRRHFLKMLAAVEFGESLAEYREDARNQPQLTPAHKTAECLRWRQILVEEQFAKRNQ